MWGAHNAVIAVADDAGILGLIPYLLLIVYSVIKALMINLRVQRPEDKGIARGILLAFLTIIIMIQFDMGYLGIVLWFFMGIIKAAGYIFRIPPLRLRGGKALLKWGSADTVKERSSGGQLRKHC